MATTLFAALLTLTPGQGVPFSPPAVLYPPPPFIEPGTEANFVTPTPHGYVPNLYPVVPAPVVIAHPEWYPYPGPAYWYANNVSPYHPVSHAVVAVVPGVSVPPKVVVPPKTVIVPPVKTVPPPPVKDNDKR